MPPVAKPIRPLSPHLQVYRPQLTTVLSILHRATGLGLALGLPVFVAWLVMVASSKPVYDIFAGWFDNPVGQVLLFGWSWAFFYHFCTGTRHLFWDAGFFLDIKNVYRTGWAAFGISALVTGYVWGYVLYDWKTGGIIAAEFVGAIVVLGIAALVLLWILSLFGGNPKKTTSMRSPLAQVRGLGSAKGGTEHWWLQRMTALALIPLTIYMVATFFLQQAYGGYEYALVWLASPFGIVLTILFLAAGFHHAASGTQVVIEDYVHVETLKQGSIIIVKFFSAVFALVGTVAILKILFFTILATMMAPDAPGQ